MEERTDPVKPRKNIRTRSGKVKSDCSVLQWERNNDKELEWNQSTVSRNEKQVKIHKGKDRGRHLSLRWKRKEKGSSKREPIALIYTTNTKGLIPPVTAVFANIVNAMVQPSIITITVNGATSPILSLISTTIFPRFGWYIKQTATTNKKQRSPSNQSLSRSRLVKLLSLSLGVCLRVCRVFIYKETRDFLLWGEDSESSLSNMGEATWEWKSDSGDWLQLQAEGEMLTWDSYFYVQQKLRFVLIENMGGYMLCSNLSSIFYNTNFLTKV